MKSLKTIFNKKMNDYAVSSKDIYEKRHGLMLAIADMSEADLNELIIFNRRILKKAFKQYRSIDDKRSTIISVVRDLDEEEVIHILDKMKSFES